MNLWQQNYDPAGNIWLSSLIASLPILFFFFALSINEWVNATLPDALRLSGLRGDSAHSCRPDKAFTPHPAR